MASFFIKTFLRALRALNDLNVFRAGSRQLGAMSSSAVWPLVLATIVRNADRSKSLN
jgi:hypothetical protein